MIPIRVDKVEEIISDSDNKPIVRVYCRECLVKGKGDDLELVDTKEEYIKDYFLQIGAYSLAHNTVYNSRINQGAILLCTVDGLFQEFKIQGNELINFQNKFLERVEQFYNQLRK